MHIVCQAKNNRQHNTLKKTPYSLMFGQFNRVPILDLPFNSNLLLQLKTETDLERLLNADIVWTDPEVGVPPTQLVDLTVVDNAVICIDEDGSSNTQINDNGFDSNVGGNLNIGKEDDNIANTDFYHTDSFDSNAGGFIRQEDSYIIDNTEFHHTNSFDSNAGGFIRQEANEIDHHEDSIPLSLDSQSGPGKCKCLHEFHLFSVTFTIF
jgi:hypothetical protein